MTDDEDDDFHRDIEVRRIAYHTNMNDAEPFHVLLFVNEESRRMVATVFAEPGRVAILDVVKLAQGTIEYALNSWPGGQYEKALRWAINDWDGNELRRPRGDNP